MRFARAALLAVMLPAVATADDGKRCVAVEFTPSDKLQIVAWLETAGGAYVDTLFITQQTGTFGIGNRPGRFDFNSGPLWPYGRRITTFPVWAHRHGMSFPAVIFQSDTDEDPTVCFTETGAAYETCGENDLSHGFDQSSPEKHFCRPLMMNEVAWDTGTCATMAFTDKGRFSATATSQYPPRTDVVRNAMTDSVSVDMYKLLDPFDAVSQPTPVGGSPVTVPWAAPADLAAGDYVLWVETSKEFDTNGTYNVQAFPAPSGVFYGEYGEPYRGQPSIVYSVPVTVGASATSGTTMTYAGYGDPAGADGAVRPPDGTITSDTPGSGAARLQLVSDSGTMYRVRVDVSPNASAQPPSAPAQLDATTIDALDVTMGFLAPGIGTSNAVVAGYDIRIRANDEMTGDNFDDSMQVTAHVTPAAAGTPQSFELDGLLPETDYWVGVRAYDGCHNVGDVAITKVTTATQIAGTVDACFVATAAYGSIMANDVELLRHFRDALLESDPLGELGVETYYTFGPAFAGVIGRSELLRASARRELAPIIARVRGMAF